MVFIFLTWLFGLVEKTAGFDKKYKMNFKIYDLTTWLTNGYPIHILPNISRSKGNETIGSVNRI